MPWLVVETGDCIGESLDDRLGAERVDAIGAGRPVKQADHVHDREQRRLAGKPFLVEGFDDALGLVVARVLRIVDGRADVIALAHVAGMRVLEEAREQAQRKRVAAEIVRRGFQFLVGAPHPVVAEQRRAGFVRQFVDIDDRRNIVLPSGNIFDRKPAGQHD